MSHVVESQSAPIFYKGNVPSVIFNKKFLQFIQPLSQNIQNLAEPMSHVVESQSAPIFYKGNESKKLFFLKRDSSIAGAFGSFLIEKNAYKTTGEGLYFHNQRQIEQEVEEIRNVVIETKEAVRETNYHSPNELDRVIKQHLDINRISDQVYQNIERRIKIERERRGL
jgi:hypothetical protein